MPGLNILGHNIGIESEQSISEASELLGTPDTENFSRKKSNLKYFFKS